MANDNHLGILRTFEGEDSREPILPRARRRSGDILDALYDEAWREGHRRGSSALRTVKTWLTMEPFDMDLFRKGIERLAEEAEEERERGPRR